MALMNKTPNPQGKGLVPVLEQLAACRPRVAVPAKRIDQITRELFTSMFVLESEFGFRPVAGRSYWLYRKGERFRLSLVAPEEWSGGGLFGQPIGECVLHADLTWTLALSDSAAADPAVQRLIAARRQALQDTLEQASTLEAALPVFEARLRFYPRAFAAGLAHSLQTSLRLGGMAGLNYHQACERLAAPQAESVEPLGKAAAPDIVTRQSD